MLLKEFSNLQTNKKKKITNEGLAGSLAGTLGGMALGQTLVPAAYSPYAMTAGSMLGGVAGNAAEEKLKQMMAKKESDQQINEVAALIPYIVPALGIALRVGASAVWNLGKFAWRHPVAATVTGVAAANPVDTYNFLKGAYDVANVVANPAEAAKEVGKAIWNNVEEAYSAIKNIVQNNLDEETIKALASVAIKYALPVAAVIAILYGGKQLYDYISKNSEKETAA
jgi:hypothetical protein